jgi:hypothetical protein
MKIFVDNHKGNTITLEVESSDTFGDLKAKIREKIGIRPDLRVDFVTGKELEDGWALVDCNIQNESTFDLLELSIIGMMDEWLCYLPGQAHKTVARHKTGARPCGTFLSSKQNFVNTLIAFQRTVHSFLSCTLDEH